MGKKKKKKKKAIIALPHFCKTSIYIKKIVFPVIQPTLFFGSRFGDPNIFFFLSQFWKFFNFQEKNWVHSGCYQTTTYSVNGMETILVCQIDILMAWYHSIRYIWIHRLTNITNAHQNQISSKDKYNPLSHCRIYFTHPPHPKKIPIQLPFFEN